MSETIGVAQFLPDQAAAPWPPTLSPNAEPIMATHHEQQWQQVLARDAAADGAFVYGVRTTGIFCRPTCPSRRPAAVNVLFFATPAQARDAGFRPCLRCKPERPGNAQRDIVTRAARLLTRQDAQPAGLRELSRATGTGRLAVMRGFRKVLGVTPREFAQGKKLATFANTLHTGPEASITDAIYHAGFGSSSRLYEQSAALGMPPRTMQQAGAGLRIRYATTGSPLGRMLVAATTTGVCAILFGDDDTALLDDLRRRFSRAELVPSRKIDGWFADAVAFVASQLTEHPIAATFPLDIRATAFQLRVWKALRAIPRGETRSYSDVAREIGRPEAVRAVGSAIGANPIALAVPCHRVVGKDGSITGYRWGLDRKQKLLAAELARTARIRPPLK